MRRAGFTLKEVLIVLGLVVILAVILFPFFSAPRESQRHVPCQSYQKNILLGFKQYVSDYDEKLPQATSSGGWIYALDPYVKSLQTYQCPVVERDSMPKPSEAGFTDYWFNRNLSGQSERRLKNTTNLIVIGDGNDGTDLSNASYNIPALPPAWVLNQHSPLHRHSGNGSPSGAVYGFLDGHVKWMQPQEITVEPSSSGEITMYP